MITIQIYTILYILPKSTTPTDWSVCQSLLPCLAMFEIHLPTPPNQTSNKHQQKHEKNLKDTQRTDENTTGGAPIQVSTGGPWMVLLLGEKTTRPVDWVTSSWCR